MARHMTPLDLTKQPPRSPRAPLAHLNLIMAARTVDKLRATLPGGNIGSYQITGFSSSLINRLGIVEHQLREAVGRAADDAEVADWIAAHSDASKFSEINAYFEAPKIGERLDDAAFVARYPIVRTLPPETARIDMLDADDANEFSATS